MKDDDQQRFKWVIGELKRAKIGYKAGVKSLNRFIKRCSTKNKEQESDSD